MGTTADDLGGLESSAPAPAPARPAPRPTRATAPAAPATTSSPAEPRPPSGPRPAKQPRPARAPAPTERRYRQTIHRVDLWTVLKISVCFYICSMAVTMVAVIALWLMGDAAGVIDSVESFLGDLLQTDDFTFLSGDILRGVLLVSAVLVVLQIVITVIAAAFYNIFAELFGGIELTISEDESAL